MNDILARNILLLGALEEIRAAAAEKNLRFIPLKGAALLAEGVYAPQEREMTDLDLLIRPRDEKNFDSLLTALKFKPMENSSQAYYRMASPLAPPIIADLHTGLRHEKDTAALWHRAAHASRGWTFPALDFSDQLLHLASHTLLHHGVLDARTIVDMARLLEFVYGQTERAGFWRKTADIAGNGGLRPVVYPVLKRLSASNPGLLSGGELAAFEPRGAEKLKSRLFEKAANTCVGAASKAYGSQAAVRHSQLLEYLLPGLYRPSLFIRYLFPGKNFLEKRYGRSSWTNRFIRPFQLIKAILQKED